MKIDLLAVLSRLSAGGILVRCARLAIAITLPLLACASLVWAFAEEPIRFRDPYTGQTGEEWEEISTIHDDLTYVLALAAGFSVTDSITLQIWDQLVDSEQIGPGDAISYTNCAGGAFYPTPDPDEVCGWQPHTHMIWPMWDSMQDKDTCVTSRFGPYSPFFHFPHNNDRELGALRDWGWGVTSTLTAYEAYAWGGPAEPTVMQASCLYTRTAVITTSIQAGSLEAFAAYLHSLADYYSHKECIAHMDSLGMPWATHTLAGHPACDYNPLDPQPDDVHGREFYTYTDSQRTDAAIQHIYGELAARSRQREGTHYPLSMDTPLTAIDGSPTLSETLYTFVHQWDFEHPAQRRAWADRIAAAVLAQRSPTHRVYWPLMIQSTTTVSTSAAAVQAPHPDTPPPSSDWGEPVIGITGTYTVYKKDFVYGTTPFLITDMRPDSEGKTYSDKESYEIRALTIYRAHDGQALLDHQPVVFFVHGGGWTDGYRDWYSFVARPFTGEKGWVTVVIDYRLTSDQVFIADQYCPDRDTCGQPGNEPYRTKAAWYPDNIDDVAAAFRWVMDHIEENGGDADAIVVFGHSAGGHLASLLATHPDHATTLRPAIQGVISMSGAYELTDLNHAFWSSVVTQTFRGGFDNTEALEQASPSTYVISGTTLPPFYLLYAEDELLNLTEQSILFKNQLEAQGQRVTISYLAGYGHYSEMEAIARIDETPTRLIVNWIEGLLRKPLYFPLIIDEGST